MHNTISLPSRNNYRSIRYTINREQNIQTADPSSLPKFRIKRNSVLESTMYKTNYLEHQISKTISVNNNEEEDKSVYLKTFTSMMNPKMTIDDKNVWKSKPLKFKIQNFRELNDSEFTLLDPFQRHYKSIQTQTNKAHQELALQSKQLKLIKGQLLTLKKRSLLNLQQIQNLSLNQIQKFRSLLKNNTIRQQQTKLRVKMEIQELQSLHKQNQKQFNNIMNKNHCLQETIFNCMPFQLKENQQWTQFPQNQGGKTLGVSSGTLC